MTFFDGFIFLVSWLAELRAITVRTLTYKGMQNCFIKPYGFVKKIILVECTGKLK